MIDSTVHDLSMQKYQDACVKKQTETQLDFGALSRQRSNQVRPRIFSLNLIYFLS